MTVSRNELRLDPWAASSLLQKAIRRGEVELAQRAAATFTRHRGAAIWRRLATIAVEDVGIGDIGLVAEVARLATDRALRDVLGSEAELIDDLSARLAATVKDRSADYLYSAATKLETALADRALLEREPVELLIGLATDVGAPLIQRAVAALLACGLRTNDEVVTDAGPVAELLDAFPVKPLPLLDAVSQLLRVRAHPFCLMLPLVWSRWWHFGAESEIAEDELPTAEFMNDVPLYTWDFHTAAGKHAIARFARENGQVASTLRESASEQCRINVAQIACFYADAAPVSRRLHWPTGTLLMQTGAVADITCAGCTFEGVTDVVQVVRQNLPHLNSLRREERGGSF